ncbi:MAG: RluA family pseudouridine synthase [Clostridia bacterium]|nr:RluA family pseudouridine synthase [Clostridia bacterium]
MNNFPTEEINEVIENEAVTFTAESASRLDSSIAENCDMSRSSAQQLIENGSVTVNGKTVTQKSCKLKSGDSVTVELPEPEDCTALPQDIPLDIVYEDEHLLVVNKPKGMVVHPAPGNPDGTLVNALLWHCKDGLSGINGVIRPGIVHRIDKDTSGLLVVAKNDKAHAGLAEQIKEHSFTRIYNALLYGHPQNDSGTVNAPIGRNPNDRKKMAVTEKNSKNAVTHFKVLEDFGEFSLCEMKLETGRTHQIRVHMSYIGYPVVGDPLYAPKEGKNKFGIVGQALHARVMGFVHPISGEYMEFSSELPAYFSEVVEKLRRNSQR